jgi:uncharacterized protein YbjQ (UPF0145 family)
VVDVPGTRQLMEQARHRALHRLHQECAGLGADGVVGVRLTVGPFYGNGMEFVATGTAVRADGEVRPPHPFTSDLTGQDFVRLVRGGWMPVALVMGLGVALRHDDCRLLSQQSSWANQELAGLTQLVSTVRSSARTGLDADVRRHGAAGVVLRDLVTNVVRVRCARSGSNSEAHDHFADVLAFGTAIPPLGRRGPEPTAPPLPMLRLDPRQRRWIR